jgi:hypothetical protein
MSRQKLIIFVVAFAALYALGIFWGLPSAMTAASDTTAPLGPLAFAAEYRDPSKSFIYPAVHQLLLLAFYAVVLVVCKLTGYLGAISSAWPYGFTDPSAVFSAFILVSNLVSLVMAIVLLLALRRMRPTETCAMWFAMLLLGLSGVFAYYARVANMDMPYLFWWVLSYVCLWRYVCGEGARRKFLVYSAVLAALSIGTKDQAAGLVLGFGFVVLLVPPRDGEGSWKERIKSAAFFSVCLIAAYVLPEVEASVRGQLLLFSRFVGRLGHILTPGGVLLGVGGMVVLAAQRRYRELLVLTLPVAAYYCSIIAKVRATEERYLLPFAIVLSIGAGVAVGAALSSRWRERSVLRALMWVVIVGVLAQQFVWSFIPVTYAQLFDTKGALARDIARLAPEGSNLLMVDMVSFNLPNRHVYDHYTLMHPPGEKLFPLSTHGENLFKPYDPSYKFVLAGSVREPGRAEWPKADLEAVQSWTYPEWIKSHIYVPAVYEFYLFRRKETP